MDTHGNIEKYRQMRKKKMLRKRIITWIAVVILIGLVVVSFERFFNMESSGNPFTGTESGATSKGFPISLLGERIVDLKSMNGWLLSLTESKFTVYTNSGKYVSSDIHGFLNPVLKPAHSNAIIYDRKGYNIKLVTQNSILKEKTFSETIQFAELSDDGKIAVVSSDSNASSVLKIYNSKFEEIYKWSSSSFIAGLAFNDSNKGLVALTYTVKNGEFTSSIVALNFSQEKILFEQKIPETLGLSVSVKRNGNIAVIGDVGAHIFDKKGTLKGSYTYNKQIIAMSNDADKNMIIVLSDTDSKTNNEIVILDDGCKVIHNYKLEAKIKDISCDGSRLLLLGNDYIYDFDMSLRLLDKMPCKKDNKKMTFIGSNAYVAGVERIATMAVN